MRPKLSFRLSEPPLIEGRREWSIFLLGAFFVFALSLGWRYYEYSRFVSESKRFVDADVLIQYTKSKNGREYEVLKLRTIDGLTFYTTSKEPIKDLSGRNISILYFPKRVTFADYLSIPFLPSAIVRVNHERSARMELFEKIKEIHPHPWIQELYGALFLALPISKELRERVTLLGASHLLALSGFHMGLLWFIIYGLLSLFYRPLQRRFFPWRHRLLDVGAVTILLLGAYLLFTDAPPSLLRAFAMVLTGWLALLLGVKLLSFSFLALCVVMLVAFLPGLLLSVGFWFSVAGVFFIYQFLELAKEWPGWVVFLFLNLWVYLAMLPVVHSIFGTFSIYQLLSIPLTILFSLFYPLSILLHIAGLGDLLDPFMLELLRLPEDAKGIERFTPLWGLILYLALCFAAVRYRVALYLQSGFMLLFFLFLVEQVT